MIHPALWFVFVPAELRPAYRRASSMKWTLRTGWTIWTWRVSRGVRRRSYGAMPRQAGTREASAAADSPLQSLRGCDAVFERYFHVDRTFENRSKILGLDVAIIIVSSPDRLNASSSGRGRKQEIGSGSGVPRVALRRCKRLSDQPWAVIFNSFRVKECAFCIACQRAGPSRGGWPRLCPSSCRGRRHFAPL